MPSRRYYEVLSIQAGLTRDLQLYRRAMLAFVALAQALNAAPELAQALNAAPEVGLVRKMSQADVQIWADQCLNMRPYLSYFMGHDATGKFLVSEHLGEERARLAEWGMPHAAERRVQQGIKELLGIAASPGAAPYPPALRVIGSTSSTLHVGIEKHERHAGQVKHLAVHYCLTGFERDDAGTPLCSSVAGWREVALKDSEASVWLVGLDAKRRYRVKGLAFHCGGPAAESEAVSTATGERSLDRKINVFRWCVYGPKPPAPPRLVSLSRCNATAISTAVLEWKQRSNKKPKKWRYCKKHKQELQFRRHVPGQAWSQWQQYKPVPLAQCNAQQPLCEVRIQSAVPGECFSFRMRVRHGKTSSKWSAPTLPECLPAQGLDHVTTLPPPLPVPQQVQWSWPRIAAALLAAAVVQLLLALWSQRFHFRVCPEDGSITIEKEKATEEFGALRFRVFCRTDERRISARSWPKLLWLRTFRFFLELLRVVLSCFCDGVAENAEFAMDYWWGRELVAQNSEDGGFVGQGNFGVVLRGACACCLERKRSRESAESAGAAEPACTACGEGQLAVKFLKIKRAGADQHETVDEARLIIDLQCSIQQRRLKQNTSGEHAGAAAIKDHWWVDDCVVRPSPSSKVRSKLSFTNTQGASESVPEDCRQEAERYSQVVNIKMIIMPLAAFGALGNLGPPGHFEQLQCEQQWAEASCRCLLRDVAHDLHMFRMCNYLHLDCKAANILLDAFGHFRLCDLGEMVSASVKTSARERGTSGWNAPEMRGVGHRGGLRVVHETHDVFSLGAVLLQFLGLPAQYVKAKGWKSLQPCGAAAAAKDQCWGVQVVPIQSAYDLTHGQAACLRRHGFLVAGSDREQRPDKPSDVRIIARRRRNGSGDDVNCYDLCYVICTASDANDVLVKSLPRGENLSDELSEVMCLMLTDHDSRLTTRQLVERFAQADNVEALADKKKLARQLCRWDLEGIEKKLGEAADERRPAFCEELRSAIEEEKRERAASACGSGGTAAAGSGASAAQMPAPAHAEEVDEEEAREAATVAVPAVQAPARATVPSTGRKISPRSASPPPPPPAPPPAPPAPPARPQQECKQQ